MTLSTSYLPAGGAARDPLDWNPEFSRRARGFAIYAALRELGREGIADLVERTSRYARELTVGIGAMPGAELIAASGLNQGLVRFGDDGRTDAVIAAINASGEAFFGGVTWQGRRAMRISACNWRTTETDVARTLAAVRTIVDSVK
jgi:glutamate/tyrosine decarboxylase-like PLP-dependent enzyme